MLMMIKLFYFAIFLFQPRGCYQPWLFLSGERPPPLPSPASFSAIPAQRLHCSWKSSANSYLFRPFVHLRRERPVKSMNSGPEACFVMFPDVAGAVVHEFSAIVMEMGRCLTFFVLVPLTTSNGFENRLEER
ncbi:hypothetical protein BKA64DRAFT_124133 [Cadophora sp. MPI-SDFR-AT-0126]|nr:hypothetical protein BKA64DRAFT_124133 [Leotiomycetes sp. MPI-SDFR-AT-0126]